ncbi:MAG: type II secretion system secretin GspD [Pseudomonadales bacterium]|nr:type II secretion system secretin GspD [Pseudomonadales bacterium]
MLTANSRRLLLGSALLALLPACTVLDKQTPANVEGPASSNSRSASSGNQAAQAAIPVLANSNNAERQALIDQINREGQALQFQGQNDVVPQAVNPEGEDIVELNYEQADLRLILEELADALDISMVIDPSINRQISIRTSADRPLQRDDIWPLIRLLSRDAGVLIEQVGDVYNARQIQGGLPAEITTPDGLADTVAAEIMQVTPLTYVSSDAVIQALEPLLAPDGEVSQLGNRNLLIISGSEYQLQRINQLLTLIDADPFENQGIHLYELNNASAAEVATELSDILFLIEGENPSYQVQAIERINALLVTAPAARGFDEVSRWVRILDSDSQEQVEQLFMYRVKNLVATELADTLSTIFEREDDNELVIQNTEEPTPRNLIGNVADDGQSATLQAAPDTTASSTASQQAGTAAVSADLSVRIVADEATNSLLIRSTARDYRQLLTTINQLDVVPLQVMVNAVIAQITLNDDTRFGVDWSRIAADADASPISTNTSTEFTPNLNGLMFTKGFLDGAARVEATLQAIASNNQVRLLARPSLTVSNNQEGEIQIGSEVPVNAGSTITTGGNETVNIQYRDTGIELYITPQINVDGVVNLVIRQILSSVDSSAPGVGDNPVFNNQEISTTVVVRNGENVVLGGLIQTDEERLNTGVPGLNRVPVVGGLFSYQQISEERRELFIVLRPEIINLNEENAVQYPEILDRFEMVAELFEEQTIQ